MLLRDLVRALIRRLPAALLIFGVTAVLGLLLVPGQPFTFTAEARIRMAASPSSDGRPLTGAGPDLLLGDVVLQRALKGDLGQHYSGVEQVRSRLSARRDRDGRTLVLTCIDTRPTRALAAVNSVARAFEAYAAESLAQESGRTLAALDEALAALAREEAALASDLRALGASEAGLASERLAETDRALASARLEIETLAVRIEHLSGRVERGETGPLPPVDTAESDRLARELAEALRRSDPRAGELQGLHAQAVQRESLQARFAPVRALLDQLREASARRDALLRSVPGLQAEAAELRRGLEKHRAAPGGDRHRDLQARLAAAADTRRHLDGDRAAAAGARDLSSRAVERVEPAHRTPLAGAALLWTLAVSVLAALAGVRVLDLFSPTLRTDHDVRQYINLPLMGSIPRAARGGDPTLLGADPRAPLTEVFNTAAALLESRGREDGSKLFCVTSAVPGEGKSTTACNLAVALARSGSRVLLVDADLRRASQHRLFGVAGETGLSSYLSGAFDSIDAVLVETGVENLALLPAGPLLEMPGPYLRCERFRALLPELRERHDFIIVDLPPVRSAADALHVAPLADGTILVLACGETRKDDATTAKGHLRGAGAKLIGCVLNKATFEGRSYDYYSAPAPTEA